MPYLASPSNVHSYAISRSYGLKFAHGGGSSSRNRKIDAIFAQTGSREVVHFGEARLVAAFLVVLIERSRRTLQGVLAPQCLCRYRARDAYHIISGAVVLKRRSGHCLRTIATPSLSSVRAVPRVTECIAHPRARSCASSTLKRTHPPRRRRELAGRGVRERLTVAAWHGSSRC